MWAKRAIRLLRPLPRASGQRLGLRDLSSQTNPEVLHDGDLRSVRAMFNLKDRNYIVTGGARGIGYSITRAIAEMGGNVAVLDISNSPVKDFSSLQAEFGVKARYIKTDVTSEESLTSAFEQSIAEFGSLDGWYVLPFSAPNLVNRLMDSVTAAGIVLDKPFVQQTWKEVSKIQEINVSQPYPSPPVQSQFSP